MDSLEHDPTLFELMWTSQLEGQVFGSAHDEYPQSQGKGLFYSAHDGHPQSHVQGLFCTRDYDDTMEGDRTNAERRPALDKHASKCGTRGHPMDHHGGRCVGFHGGH
ncbi:unnamed protein product [Linum trigynum]|uniref:Uncharacterized protein n=1 Tax=Linum trigynum TaxID=586398 RepID=A0AAV2F9U5_9ROSI